MARDPEKKDPAASPFNNAFAKLGEKRPQLPAGPAQPLVVPLAASKPGPARAVLRREKKGHGGKEVTRVEKLELRAAELERWCKDLKRDLGVGGHVDGDDLVFQGDQRERLEKLLVSRGVRKIVS